MSRYLQPTEIPYGVYYCRTCGQMQPCDVAPGANRLDPECALECLLCREPIGEEVDVVERWPLPPDETRRQTLSDEEREAGRALARKMALGMFDREYPVQVPGPAAAPPPGFRERQVADIERLRGRR